MKNLLITAASSAAFLILIVFKILHWRNYKQRHKRQQQFRLLYPSTDIDGTSSKIKRDFMQASNLITLAAFAALFLLVSALIWGPVLWDD